MTQNAIHKIVYCSKPNKAKGQRKAAFCMCFVIILRFTCPGFRPVQALPFQTADADLPKKDSHPGTWPYPEVSWHDGSQSAG